MRNARSAMFDVSTLAELRDFVETTKDMPASSTVRARTAFRATREGALIQRLHAETRRMEGDAPTG